MKYAVPLIVLGAVVLAMVSTPHTTSTALYIGNSGLLAAEIGGASADSAKSSAKAADPEKPKAKADAKTGEDKGIGPIKELKLGPIDDKMVADGQLLFSKKCTVCHQLDSKKVGPALRDVANQQAPEFIMNMILNSGEMEKKNPYIKKLIAQYQTYMSGLDLNKDQARSVLEYLRSEAAKGKPK
jgi:cytochrome c551/c552